MTEPIKVPERGGAMSDYRMDAVIGTAKHIKELADAQIAAIETDHAAALRERDERIAKLEKAAQALVDAMETCHECKGTVLVEEQPVHCEDCSSDCDSHEGAECPTIYSLHLALKLALEAK